MIGPPHGLSARAMGKRHGPIIRGIGWIVAPPVIGLNSRKGQPGQRRRMTVRPVKNALERPATGRCCTISFTFGRDDAPAAQRTAVGSAAKAYRAHGGASQSGDDQRLTGYGHGPLQYGAASVKLAISGPVCPF